MGSIVRFRRGVKQKNRLGGFTSRTGESGKSERGQNVPCQFSNVLSFRMGVAVMEILAKVRSRGR